jgi:hypothetical protein
MSDKASIEWPSGILTPGLRHALAMIEATRAGHLAVMAGDEPQSRGGWNGGCLDTLDALEKAMRAEINPQEPSPASAPVNPQTWEYADNVEL